MTMPTKDLFSLPSEILWQVSEYTVSEITGIGGVVLRKNTAALYIRGVRYSAERQANVG